VVQDGCEWRVRRVCVLGPSGWLCADCSGEGYVLPWGGIAGDAWEALAALDEAVKQPLTDLGNA